MNKEKPNSTERKRKNVMEFWGIENAPTEKEARSELYKVLYYFVEADSFAPDDGRLLQPPIGTNGVAVPIIGGGTLNEAVRTAIKIRTKWPYLSPVPNNAYDLLNWCLDKAKDEDADPQGCVAQHEYKWQRVLRKVKKHWKLLKDEGHPFPSYRSIARDIQENPGTVTTAIKYSRPLVQAYNKDKPVSKKIKYIEPPKLDFVGVKAGRKGGNPDPTYEAEKDDLLRQIKQAARKEMQNFDPDIRAGGKMVLRNIKAISTLYNKGLRNLLTVLTENPQNRKAKLEAAFERDKLK